MALAAGALSPMSLRRGDPPNERDVSFTGLKMHHRSLVASPVGPFGAGDYILSGADMPMSPRADANTVFAATIRRKRALESAGSASSSTRHFS